MPLSFRGAELLSLCEWVESGHFRHMLHSIVSEHLSATVWKPLASLHRDGPWRSDRTGFRVDSLFGCPPTCTTARRIPAPNPAAELTPAAEAAPTAETVDIPVPTYRVRTHSEVGLDECLVITPESASCGAQDYYPPSTALIRVKALVVVDPACGEAVLRGSDIYAPGVVAATRSFRSGDLVLLVAVVGGARQPTRAAFLRPEQLVAREPQPPQQSTENGSGESSRSYGPCVVVGLGVCVADRETVLAPRSQGVAIWNVWNPRAQPSRSVLATALRSRPIQEEFVSAAVPSVLFLQNWSSMVPAAWLLDSIRETFSAARSEEGSLNPAKHGALRILDACSAPGGKTSQLALRLSALSDGHRPCRLFACERSATRHAALCRLLEEHLGPGAAAVPGPTTSERRAEWRSANGVVDVRCGDVRELLGKRCFFANAIDPSGDVFDYVLLDPPCTGLGLRPRLTPHPHSLNEIQQSAAYQRKLFASCWESLAVGGRLCYSTCTISTEENEDNVVAFLKEHRDAVIVPAWTAEQRRLLHLMRLWSGIRASEISALSQRNARDSLVLSSSRGAPSGEGIVPPLLVLRCGPMTGSDDSDDGVDLETFDGPGFFVTLLEKVPRKAL